MNKENIMTKHHPEALSQAIGGIMEEMGEVFARSNHRLTILAPSQEDLDLIATDFCHTAYMTLGVLQGNLFEPYYTEQMYRSLKAASTYPASYWENDLQEELTEFGNKIATLETLSRLYTQHFSAMHPECRIELTFVVSKPESPLMAVFSGSKAMVYNFSG